MVYSGAEDNSGKNESFLDVDSDVGLGLGVAYNFDSRFALGFDFTYLKPRYTAQYNNEEDSIIKVKKKKNNRDSNSDDTKHLDTVVNSQ